MRAIIIAGGLGTRLRPLTFNRPKPLVSMANKPFILHQIALLKKCGIKEIILNLHYLPKAMELMLGDGSDLGVRLFYSIEKNPLGTAGAVKNAEKYFDEGPLVVFNADILTDIDILELISFHKERKATATLALTRVEDPTAYGLVVTEGSGKVTKFLEKPNWETITTNTVNAGIYILDPEVFRDVPKARPYSFERELFPKMLEGGSPVFAKVSDSYWMDIGSPKKYLQAHRDILNGDVSVTLEGYKKKENVLVHRGASISNTARLRGPSMIGANAEIGDGAYISHHAVIGENVVIHEKAMVEDSVILRNSKIGKGVKLKNCIIGENCIIEDSVEMIYGVVLGDYSIVKKGSKLI